MTGGTGEVYARTGYLGFLRRTEAIGSDGGIYEKFSVKLSHYFDYIFFFSDYHDAVFVVGSLDETLILRGMRYHPIDVENSVMKSHKKIAEW